jgi:hypothetical protein
MTQPRVAELASRCYDVLDYCEPRFVDSEPHRLLMVATYRLLRVLMVLDARPLT